MEQNILRPTAEVRYAQELAALAEWDSKNPKPQGWKLSRISHTALAVLRCALYELCYMPDVPPAAALNEAVELSKKYAYKADSGFINGVLNAYLGELDGAEK